MVDTATRPIKVELFGNNNDGGLRRFTIADGTAVSKYDLLQLTDPRTVTKMTTAAAGAANACAGIAAEEHVASQGVTSISVYTQGIFDIMCSAAVTLGAPVTFSLNNFVNEAIGSGALYAGYAMETGAAEEVINVRVDL